MTRTTTQPAKDDPRRSTARWLRDGLWSEVMGGGLAGGLLPSEASLMLAYGAPRAAVREALDLLRREGLVERIPGTGTLAVAQRRAAKMVDVHGFRADCGAAAVTGASNRVLAHEIVPLPRVAAARLEAEPGEDCLLLEYLGYHYGQVLGVYTNYVRFPEAGKVAAAPFQDDWYSMLIGAGLEIGETDLLIDVLAADAPLAGLLDMEVGRPVLGFEQVIRDHAGRAYDYAILRSRGDRLSLLSRSAGPNGVREELDG